MQNDVSWNCVLEHHASRTPDKALCIADGEAVSYRAMLDRSASLAAGLAARGVRKGDVVGLLSYNCSEFLEVIFAANHLGAIAMPINWRLAAAEVQYILEHSRAAAFVCGADLIDLGSASLAAAASSPAQVSIGATVVDGWERLVDLRVEPNVRREHAEGDTIHRLMYTSGTTGRPKGVMITHSNLAWKNVAHVTEFGFASTDVALACGPMYHVGALDLTITSMISVGATTILHRSFDAAAVVDEIERSNVTQIWLAPAMVNGIVNLPGIDGRDLSSVKVVIGGGEKMPIPYIERLQRLFPNAWFADAYGLTETVSGDTFLDRDSTISKLGSVGRACLFLEVDIWDEEGRSVPVGERGEIVLRGPKVFKGYWRDPEASEKAFAGGWFHTGDIGVFDDDHYLYIVDRLKDMILSGGENIAGSEVERVLYTHPAVREAAVIGRPDEKWGEVPIAFVALHDGATVTPDELIEHCRGQLAKFKVPKAVTLIDALPRNPSGKVLKRELRAGS